MTNEEILEKQVDALEKLLQLKQAVINELEKKLETSQHQQLNQPFYPHTFTPQPYWICSDGSYHSYPQYWTGTIPPSCTKCGLAQQNGGITVTTTSGQLSISQDGYTIDNRGRTTGYVQPV